MVQVGGVTYRIVRRSVGEYDVVRILDDSRIGGFSLGKNPGINAEESFLEVVRNVARAALQAARTSWVPRAESRVG